MYADYAQGIALAERGLSIAQAEQLERHAGLCLEQLGMIALRASDFDRAIQMFEQVLAIHEKTGRMERIGRAAIGHLGKAAMEQGRYDIGLQYSQRYLESCEAMDDPHDAAYALYYLAYVWLRLGNFEKSISLNKQSANRAVFLGNQEWRSLALHTSAWAYRNLGQLAESLLCASESVTLARKLDAPLALAFGLGQLAETQMALLEDGDDWDEVAANFRESAAILHGIGKSAVAYEAEIGLAELLRRRGQIDMVLQQIAPIMPCLPIIKTHGWDEPIRAYVVCVQVLRDAHDSRADALLDQGLHLLFCLAQNTSDPTLRQQFLNAFPAHLQLRAL